MKNEGLCCSRVRSAWSVCLIYWIDALPRVGDSELALLGLSVGAVLGADVNPTSQAFIIFTHIQIENNRTPSYLQDL